MVIDTTTGGWTVLTDSHASAAISVFDHNENDGSVYGRARNISSQTAHPPRGF